MKQFVCLYGMCFNPEEMEYAFESQKNGSWRVRVQLKDAWIETGGGCTLAEFMIEFKKQVKALKEISKAADPAPPKEKEEETEAFVIL